jgi:hypothetical protein
MTEYVDSKPYYPVRRNVPRAGKYKRNPFYHYNLTQEISCLPKLFMSKKEGCLSSKEEAEFDSLLTSAQQRNSRTIKREAIKEEAIGSLTNKNQLSSGYLDEKQDSSGNEHSSLSCDCFCIQKPTLKETQVTAEQRCYVCKQKTKQHLHQVSTGSVPSVPKECFYCGSCVCSTCSPKHLFENFCFLCHQDGTQAVTVCSKCVKTCSGQTHTNLETVCPRHWLDAQCLKCLLV